MNRKDSFFTFSEGFYARIRGNIDFFIISGILLVGITDLFYIFFDKKIYAYFTEGPAIKIADLAILLMAAIVIGIVDIIFFALPMSDFFNFLSRKLVEMGVIKAQINKSSNNESIFEKRDEKLILINRVRFARIYIFIHLFALPYNIIIYFVNRMVNENSSSYILLLLAFIDIFLLIWFLSVIAKGARVVYNIPQEASLICFIVIFGWQYLLSYAISYMTNNWIFQILQNALQILH